MSSNPTQTLFATLPNGGINVFYRIAGPPTAATTILLLHGYPSSSNQYRNLIPPLTAAGYRVIAPDLPAFGFTEVPASLNYNYTFSNLAETTTQFLDALSLHKFAMYIFDYGAPVGLRIAASRPSAVQAIISQNGNAYDEGLGAPWETMRAYWADTTGKLRETIRQKRINLDAIRNQYLSGTPSDHPIDPASYWLDWALMQRPGQDEILLDLFKDYESNVKLYPRWQEYFRESQVPLLAVWGKNDASFIPAGAEAFKRDLPKAQIELWDGGHFLAESHAEDMAGRIVRFLRECEL